MVFHAQSIQLLDKLFDHFSSLTLCNLHSIEIYDEFTNIFKVKMSVSKHTM